MEKIEDLEALIERYGLDEDLEHIIIPYTDKKGKRWKCYILKRRYIRIVYSEDHFVDYPLVHVIMATVKYPELLLSEALPLFYEDSGETLDEVPLEQNNGYMQRYQPSDEEEH